VKIPNYGFAPAEMRPWVAFPFPSSLDARQWFYENAGGPVSTLVNFGAYCGINPVTFGEQLLTCADYPNAAAYEFAD
jgi:hypothetical protein